MGFKAEKSSKSWLSSTVAGEGVLQTFSGTGSVWIAPTKGVYESLSRSGDLKEVSRPPAFQNALSPSKKALRRTKKPSGCFQSAVFAALLFGAVLLLTATAL